MYQPLNKAPHCNKMPPLLCVLSVLCLGIILPKASGYCSYNGTEFLVIAPILHPYNPNDQFNITVCGEPGTTVTVSNPDYNDVKTIGQDEYVVFVLLYDGNSIQFEPIPFQIQKKSFHVASTHQVGVYVSAEGVDGYTAVAKSSELRYMTSSYIVEEPCMSYFAVAAFSDSTELTINLRINENVHEAQFWDQEYADNDQVIDTIQAFDVYFVYGMNDITGTRILSNKPVSVFSGADCVHICTLFSGVKCNGFLEQMLPLSIFGQNILTFPIPSSNEPTSFRAIATEKNTMFAIPELSIQKGLAKLGNFAEWSKDPPTGNTYTADNPVIPVQFQASGATGSGSWPLHITFTPLIQFAIAHRIFAFEGYSTEAVVIIAVSTDNTYSLVVDGVKQVSMTVMEVHTDYRALVVSVSPGVHTLWSEDERMTAVYVYGDGTTTSSSLHGACWELKHPVQSSSVLASEEASSVQSSVLLPSEEANLAQSSNLLPSTVASLVQSSNVIFSEANLAQSSNLLQSAEASLVQSSSLPVSEDAGLLRSSNMVLSGETSYQPPQETLLPTLPSTSAYHGTIQQSASTVTESSDHTMDSLTLLSTHSVRTVVTTITVYQEGPKDTSTSIRESFSREPSTKLYTVADTRVMSGHSTQAVCSYICNTPVDVAAVSRSVAQVKKNLTLDKYVLGTYIRKHISAPDDRPIAVGFGYTGVILIAVTVFCLLLGDVGTIIMAIKGNIRKA